MLSHRTPEGDRDLANEQPFRGIEIQSTRGQENDGQKQYKQRDSDSQHHCALLHVELAGAQKDQSLELRCL